jgi:prepilin-type N-terminal cleavage/methylation domain-containing protein/prepilin-type processing-associated H-X9-DG protein
MNTLTSRARSGASFAARRGFTLVELLVVIGIIALLISILLPSLSRARESANSVVCASNMRQLGIAMQFYLVETGLYVPAASPQAADVLQRSWLPLLTMNAFSDQFDWENQWNANVSNRQSTILVCPSDPTAENEVRRGSNNVEPEFKGDRITKQGSGVSYLANGKVLRVRGHAGLNQKPLKAGSLSGASETAMFFEKLASGNPNLTGAVLSYNYQVPEWVEQQIITLGRSYQLDGRHGNANLDGVREMNIAYGDGHVGRRNRDEGIDDAITSRLPDTSPNDRTRVFWGSVNDD